MLKVKILLIDKLNNEYLVAKFAKISEAQQCANLLQSLTSTEDHWYYIEHKNRRHLADVRVVGQNLKSTNTH